MHVTFSDDRSTAIRAMLVDVAHPLPRRLRRAVTAALALLVGIGAGVTGTAIALAAEKTPVTIVSTVAPPMSATSGAVELGPHAYETFEKLAREPGFVDGGADLDGRFDVKVYWYGPFGASAREIVDGAARLGVSVGVVEMRHSTESALEMARHVVEGLARDGFEIASFKVAGLNDVIEISGPRLSESPEIQADVHRAAERLLEPDFRLIVVLYDEPIPAVGTIE